MQRDPEADIAQRLEADVLHRGVAPAAVAAAQGPGLEGGLVVACGTAHPEAVFDLASLSKPILALTVLDLAMRGALDWQTPLSALLPEVAGSYAGARTVEQLLCHRAGLIAHVELFRAVYGGEPFRRDRGIAKLAASLRTDVPLASFTGPDDWAPPLYSDVGYQLMGFALERRYDAPLDSLVADALGRALGEETAHELGSARQWHARSRDFALRVMPTEFVPERGGLVHGAVHDDNAWVMSGYGSAGHAGQFGTARGVLGLGRFVLERLIEWSKVSVSRRASHPFDRLFRRRPGGTLRLGLDGVAGSGSSAGSLAGPETVGHLGFTGTSFWVDPEQRAITVLLTNRVCPSRQNLAIRAARPAVHDALWRHAVG